MSKILIFGNSGSGKSTLARKVSNKKSIAHLDLDTIAWQVTIPPTRTSIANSQTQINAFMNVNENWVIEGCYADLLNLVINSASEVLFLNLPVELCVINAKNRPWEPHKYKSKAEQDANLSMLIQWIEDYPNRSDCLSQKAHRELYNSFNGKKSMYTSNSESNVI